VASLAAQKSQEIGIRFAPGFHDWSSHGPYRSIRSASLNARSRPGFDRLRRSIVSKHSVPYGVRARDAPTILAVVTVLASVTLIATTALALGITGINPGKTLREE
jgi:hypothetical protein